MSIAPDPSPPLPGGFVHDLPPARDWQDRPEFHDLCQWWREGGPGICSLIGFGGAGKTAITERFLRVLPGGYPEHPKIPKDLSLETPTRVFVFSFYKASPDTFFTELAAWLEGRQPTAVAEATSDSVARPSSYLQAWDLLVKAGKCLLVLDGLEKVQDDGSRGVFGQILDRRLRDFVLRIANGSLYKVSMVVTSRFRLFDPIAESTDCYGQIDVDKLPSPAAVQLLRARGVRQGTDKQLEAIAEDLSFHALSINLVGGYIALFCEGDPQRFSSLSPMEEEFVEDSDPALDPRIAALRKQDRRFARLTERYHQTLADNNPAALALLQCICLFRLGVDAQKLTSVLTGEEKEIVSGFGLANLSKQQLQAKLNLLVEMRLIEVSRQQALGERSQAYTVHPAVRDGFLNKFDAETRRRRHNAVGRRLQKSLGSHPYNPSDPSTLDTLEEMIHHNIAAGHRQYAFDIYVLRIGGYSNLGWRLSDYARGERICRMFTARWPSQVTEPPEGLSKKDQAFFLTEWALYLKDLGQLAAAVSCYETALKMHTESQEWYDASVENQTLAEILLTSGSLRAGLSFAENALRTADLTHDPTRSWYSHAVLAQARSYRGEVNKALSNFNDSRHWQHQVVQQPDRPQLLGMPGIQYALLMAWLGRVGEAVQLVEANQSLYEEAYGPNNSLKPILILLLADLSRQQGNLTASRELLHEVYRWALDRDAKEQLCGADLVQAKIELAAFADKSLLDSADASFASVESALENGLRTAREYGFGILHIDLLLVRAQLALYKGHAVEAERDVRAALDEGVHPSAESGLPELPAATDPECGYAWGIAEGRQLLAEILLLQAAQKLGRAEFVPKRLDRLPVDVRGLMDRARKGLDQALELWHKLKDPESDADVNPRGERTKRVLEGLEGGTLTEYPLEPLGLAEPAAPPETPEPEKRTRPMSRKKHAFLSYCRDNRTDVATLYNELVASGEAVWWDQDILPGQDWRLEIRKAMRNAYAFILCLSEETADRITSGIYPEVLDAIAAYRDYAPGSVFLIPVRLSDCEIPLIEIDGTRTLDRLEFVDLFPPIQRAAGLGRLLKALQAAPYHP